MSNLKIDLSRYFDSEKFDEIFAEELEKRMREGISYSLNEMFGRYGTLTKVIEKKVEEAMLPSVENRDYSDYIVKLDQIITNVIKESTVDHVQIMKNLEKYLTQPKMKEITLEELFIKYMEYVEENVDTFGLEVEFDDRPYFESVHVTCSVETDDGEPVTRYESKSAIITFNCPHDLDLKYTLPIYQTSYRRETSGGGGWAILPLRELESIRNASGFQIFLMRLAQDGTLLTIDKNETEMEDWVSPNEEPEPSW